MLGNLVSKYPSSGFLPGALMGGAGLIGAGLVSATGAGKYVGGAAAIGAGASKGASWLGSKSFGGNKSPAGKEDTSEELSKVSSIGLLSVDKLDAIYNNVVDIRKFLGGQDPESQAREVALDEQVKKKELIEAIKGMGKGGGGGGAGGVKSGLLGLFKDLLGIGALAALFTNLDKIQEFLSAAPDWIDKISIAIDNIMEFVKDLDGFFESIGIEFGGAAMMGIGAGMRRSKKIAGRNPAARRAKVEAAKAAKAAKAKAKAERLAKRATDRAKARALRAEAAKARAAAKAAIKAEAKRLRAERNAARRQRISIQAEKIRTRFTASMSRIGGRPGGSPVKPVATSATSKTSTPFKRGGLARGLGASFKTKQANKARAQQALLDERAEQKRLAKESRKQRMKDRADRIKRSAVAMRERIKAKLATVKTPPDARGPRGKIASGGNAAFRLNQAKTPADARGPRGKIAAGGNKLFKAASAMAGRWAGMGQQTGDAYKKPPKISTPKRGSLGGRIKLGLTSLTPIASKMFGGRSTGTGGRLASEFDTPKGYKVTTSGDGGVAKKNFEAHQTKGPLGRMLGGIGDKVKQSGLVKDASTIIKSVRGRPGGSPVKPKIPPKLGLAMKVLPKWAVKLVMKAMGETGKAVGKTLLRIAGPLLLAYEIFQLGKAWQAAPGDKDPFGDEPADIAFKQGMLRLGSSYGGAYFGAIGAGMLAGMFTVNPLVAFGASVVGGVTGAIAGDKLMERWLMTDTQKKDANLQKKKSKLAKLGRNIEIMHQSGQSIQAMGYERDYDKLAKEISVLEAAGSLDDNANVMIIQNIDQSSSNVSQTGSATSIVVPLPPEEVVPYGAGPGLYGRF